MAAIEDGSQRIRRIFASRPLTRDPAELKWLSQTMLSQPGFFAGMPWYVIAALFQRATFAWYERDEVIFRQGTYAQGCYLLLSGAATVFRLYEDTGHSQKYGLDSDSGARCGALSAGDVLGERALVDSNLVWPESALASESGAQVVCIDRALFNHFVVAAKVSSSSIPARVVAALRVACCRKVLQTPGRDRSEEDVQMLVGFLHGLEAFKSLSHDLMQRLCKGMSLFHALPGTVICEEDDKGDSMFVVLAGGCTIRADAPPTLPTQPANQRLRGATLTNPTDLTRHATMPKHGDCLSVAVAYHVTEPTQNGVASNSRTADAISGVPRRKLESHPSNQWIQQFMCSAVRVQDPDLAGHGNDMTPLAKIAAAKWRRTIADVEAEEAIKLAQKEAEEIEARERNEGMAALLGKAAANHWKATTFGACQDTSHAPDGGTRHPGVWQAWSQNKHEEGAAQAWNSEPVAATAEQTLAAPPETVQSLPSCVNDARPRRLYNPSKQQLASMGKSSRPLVSQQLRAELARRASLDTVLIGMEKLVKKRASDRRLGQSDSRKITRALNRAMLSGASKQVGALRGQGRHRKQQAHRAEAGSAHSDMDDWKSSVDNGSDIDDYDTTSLDGRSTLATDCSTTSQGELNAQAAWLQGTQYLGLIDGSLEERPLVTCSEAERQFGPVVRTVIAGDSFGELALLQPHNMRTASVIAGLPPSNAHDLEMLNSARPSDGLEHGAELIQVPRSLFDASVTGMQAAQLEVRLKFLRRIQAFSEVPRDTLTALAVFVRKDDVPADCVLLSEGHAADRVILIESGEVGLVLEGERTGNPMGPPAACRADFDKIAGMEYVNAAALPAVRKAMDRSLRRRSLADIEANTVLSRTRLSIAASDSIRDKGIGGSRNTDEASADLQPLSTVQARHHHGHSGMRHGPGWEIKPVRGMRLLTLASGEMVGEVALGSCLNAEEEQQEDATRGARAVHVAVEAGTFNRQMWHSKGTIGCNNKETPVEVMPSMSHRGYPATVVTTQACTLLSISRRDLLRFSPAIANAIRDFAGARVELVSGLRQRAQDARQWLEASLTATRAIPDLDAPSRPTQRTEFKSQDARQIGSAHALLSKQRDSVEFSLDTTHEPFRSVDRSASGTVWAQTSNGARRSTLDDGGVIHAWAPSWMPRSSFKEGHLGGQHICEALARDYKLYAAKTRLSDKPSIPTHRQGPRYFRGLSDGTGCCEHSIASRVGTLRTSVLLFKYIPTEVGGSNDLSQAQQAMTYTIRCVQRL